MATFLDLTLIDFFDRIFVVLLIWTIIFAILQKTKAVSDGLGINAIIAVAIAFLALISDTIIQLISFMVPWFALLIIFLVLLILLFQIFGVTDVSAAVNDKTVQWTLIGVGIVIVIAAFGTVFGQQLAAAAGSSSTDSGTATAAGGTGTTNFQQNIYSTLFNPKVLGMLVLFGVAIFAVILLSG